MFGYPLLFFLVRLSRAFSISTDCDEHHLIMIFGYLQEWTLQLQTTSETISFGCLDTFSDGIWSSEKRSGYCIMYDYVPIGTCIKPIHDGHMVVFIDKIFIISDMVNIMRMTVYFPINGNGRPHINWVLLESH